jgi:hypothetical protein
MADFDERVSVEAWEEAQTQMRNLAVRLKQDFGLEKTVDRAIDRHNIALTPGALLTLVAPLVEAAFSQHYRHRVGVQDARLDTTLATVERSLDELVSEMKMEPAAADRIPSELIGIDPEGRELPMRSSLSALKAVSRRFCRIPPFCGE